MGVAVASIRSASGTISIYMDGKAYSVAKDHVNYDKINQALNSKTYDGLDKLIDVGEAVRHTASKTVGGEKVQVLDGQILYDGEAVHNAVSDKILSFVREKFDFAPLVKFLENLMENPSKASVDNLYRFLEHNNMPITEEGFFISYKRVKDNFKDIYSGTFDNSPGQVVKMNRNKVADNPEVHCSFGLHCASLKYARDEYGNGTGKLVVVKVNPMNVVSCPTDYNNQKMRVCKYEVIEEMKDYYKPYVQEDFVNREDECDDEDEEFDDEDELDDDSWDDDWEADDDRGGYWDYNGKWVENE